MTIPNPVDNEDLYDSIVLGGVRSPGQVTLSGHDRKIDWDVKAGSAQVGATTTLKSIPLIEFTATFYLADLFDFESWPSFRVLIDSTVSGKTPKALDIYHPDLATVGIKSVVKASMGGVVHDGKGGQTIVVKFQEYAPPKPKGGSPKPGIRPTLPDPNQAALDQLAALTNQYNNTPWG